MISNSSVTLGDQLNTYETSESAVAMFDEHGTVVAWTRAAEQLVRYSAGDVVGRAASLVLPFSEEAPTISAFVEQCRAQNGWSGTTAVRHRDGRKLNINLRISMLRGAGRNGAVAHLRDRDRHALHRGNERISARVAAYPRADRHRRS
ncbi:PAS domain S-box protein [Streptomyces sp. NPDC057460]|uniref:PAS domain S-box protein n=1 Tax=Streptomyces sp. NPDC057460 TaxID=3346141 RepID=UPI003674576F